MCIVYTHNLLLISKSLETQRKFLKTIIKLCFLSSAPSLGGRQEGARILKVEEILRTLNSGSVVVITRPLQVTIINQKLNCSRETECDLTLRGIRSSWRGSQYCSWGNRLRRPQSWATNHFQTEETPTKEIQPWKIIIEQLSWMTIVQPTKQFAIRTNYRKSLEDRINGLSSFNHSSY